jgi:V/A-type H+-transporting ATPase subunit C
MIELVVIIFGLILSLFIFVFISAQQSMPYIYSGAKVSSWEAKLLHESRMLEFADAPKVSSILAGLDETGYRTYLANIPRDEDVDVVAVEQALNGHMRDSYRELLEVVPEKDKPIVAKLLKKIDLYNLKTVVAAIHNKVPKGKRFEEMLPSPTMSQERLEMLASAENFDTLQEFLKDTEYFDVFSTSLEKYKEGGLPIVLFSLDKAYYSSLWADVQDKNGRLSIRKKFRSMKEILAKRAQRPILKKIVGYEIDAINIKTILRLKRDGATPEEIMYPMILPSYELSEKTLIWMAEAKSVQEAVSGISHTTYGPILAKALPEFEATGSLLPLEKALDEGQLKMCKWMLITKFFSIAPVLMYIRLKEIEVKNLRAIIRLKVDNVEPEKIKETIVRVPKFEL